MSGKITLIGDTWTSTRPVTVSTRPVARQDADGLARLFFTAYDDGSVTSQAHALEILHHMFDGEYGAVLPKASPVVVDDAGRIIAAAVFASLADRPTLNAPVTSFSRAQRPCGSKASSQPSIRGRTSLRPAVRSASTSTTSASPSAVMVATASGKRTMPVLPSSSTSSLWLQCLQSCCM